jgi:hypothetical protein
MLTHEEIQRLAEGAPPAGEWSETLQELARRCLGHVAVVTACNGDFSYTRIISVLGPFADMDDAHVAGCAETRKHMPGDQGDEDESSIEFDVCELLHRDVVDHNPGDDDQEDQQHRRPWARSVPVTDLRPRLRALLDRGCFLPEARDLASAVLRDAERRAFDRSRADRHQACRSYEFEVMVPVPIIATPQITYIPPEDA